MLRSVPPLSGISLRRRLNRALDERDESRAQVSQLRTDCSQLEDECRRFIAERDDARELVREHARLWTESLSDGRDSGPLDSLMAGSTFSYHAFRMRRDEILRPDNPYALGDVMRERVAAAAEPVRFERLHSAGPPSNVAFTTVCTDKFVPGLEALTMSMVAQYPDLDSDWWIFHDGELSSFNQARLLGQYPNFKFASRDASRYEAAARGDSPNHERIGALGYLTLESLLLADYRRVVLLDADLLVTGDISALWSGDQDDDARVVADAGALPFATSSTYTGRVVLNSGVISLSNSMLGETAYAEALECVDRMNDVSCPILSVFADQKFWNVFLGERDVVYLPANLNANKQLIDRYMPHKLAEASIIHFTGTKPWFSFADRSTVSPDERRRAAADGRRYPRTFATWDTAYSQLVGSQRRANHAAAMGEELECLRGSAAGFGAVLIGNGPSLAETELSAVGDRVKIAFNWFVNHEEFDEVGVDHLMVMSHMFFGGWNTSRPMFPPGYIERLTDSQHRPKLWFPFYYRELIEATPDLRPFDVGYLLLEKPFKEFAKDLGYLKTDLTGFLSDAHTGVLTAGLPLALHLGCTDIVLVGCDASYGASETGDYFYPPASHTSASTSTKSLHGAWADGGPAHYCYELGVDAAIRAGASLRDATVGGRLTAVPKVELDGLRA